MAKPYHYLFGPVPSRRFGQSLGVDLTPYKTCSLDCVFCQLGRTVNKTTHREAYVPIDAVLSELDTWLRADGRADYITLSGSGEPTLHAQFGEILASIHHNSSIPAALLTNGTLLHRPQVCESACRAGVVKITLSAWDQASFERVNRPHSRVRFDPLIEGQIAFRAQFKGRLWTEVFLMEGINSQAEQVRKISRETVAKPSNQSGTRKNRCVFYGDRRSANVWIQSTRFENNPLSVAAFIPPCCGLETSTALICGYPSITDMGVK